MQSYRSSAAQCLLTRIYSSVQEQDKKACLLNNASIERTYGIFTAQVSQTRLSILAYIYICIYIVFCMIILSPSHKHLCRIQVTKCTQTLMLVACSFCYGLYLLNSIIMCMKHWIFCDTLWDLSALQQQRCDRPSSRCGKRGGLGSISLKTLILEFYVVCTVHLIGKSKSTKKCTRSLACIRDF
jgi:hypothetical protein